MTLRAATRPAWFGVAISLSYGAVVMPPAVISIAQSVATVPGSLDAAPEPFVAAPRLPLAPPQAPALAVDTARSRLVAKLNKAGLLRFLGHEHGVVATEWSAEVVFDEQNLGSSRVVVEVAVAGLIIDSVEARELAGVDPDGPNAGEVEEIRTKMLSEDQLDAARHATIRFESDRLQLRGDRLRLDGTLTIHGSSREVEVDGTLERSADAYVLRGAFEIEQRDFGIEPVSIGGVVKVANNVDVTFEIYARRAR